MKISIIFNYFFEHYRIKISSLYQPFKILKVLRFQKIFERLKAFLRFWLSFKSLWESVIVIADWLISDFIPKYDEKSIFRKTFCEFVKNRKWTQKIFFHYRLNWNFRENKKTLFDLCAGIPLKILINFGSSYLLGIKSEISHERNLPLSSFLKKN